MMPPASSTPLTFPPVAVGYGSPMGGPAAAAAAAAAGYGMWPMYPTAATPWAGAALASLPPAQQQALMASMMGMTPGGTPWGYPAGMYDGEGDGSGGGGGGGGGGDPLHGFGYRLAPYTLAGGTPPGMPTPSSVAAAAAAAAAMYRGGGGGGGMGGRVMTVAHMPRSGGSGGSGSKRRNRLSEGGSASKRSRPPGSAGSPSAGAGSPGVDGVGGDAAMSALQAQRISSLPPTSVHRVRALQDQTRAVLESSTNASDAIRSRANWIGVSWVGRLRKYRSFIFHPVLRKTLSCGTFATAYEAAKARHAAIAVLPEDVRLHISQDFVFDPLDSDAARLPPSTFGEMPAAAATAAATGALATLAAAAEGSDAPTAGGSSAAADGDDGDAVSEDGGDGGDGVGLSAATTAAAAAAAAAASSQPPPRPATATGSGDTVSPPNACL